MYKVLEDGGAGLGISALLALCTLLAGQVDRAHSARHAVGPS
jgi:hypothetical protein